MELCSVEDNQSLIYILSQTEHWVIKYETSGSIENYSLKSGGQAQYGL